MSLLLSEPIESVFIIAENDGLHIQCNCVNLEDESCKLAELKPLTSLGCQLPTLVPRLLEQGYAEPSGQSVILPYDCFVSLGDEYASAFNELVPWSPFYIELSSSGTLGRDDFKYQIKYFLGTNQIAAPQQIGCFVSYLDTIYRLDPQTFALIESIKRYRGLSADIKNSPESLIHFAAIKGLADGVGAQIDQYIRSNKVLIPPMLGVDLIEEQNGRISFVPYIEGVPRESLSRVFLQSENVTDLFADDGEGGRVRIVFTQEQQEVLQRISKVRHLGGSDKTKVLRNPQAVFEGVASAVNLGLCDFGPRVKGIGNFPFVSQPVIQRSDTGIFDDPESEHGGQAARLQAGINCRYHDGTEETVYFQSKDEVIQFNHEVQATYTSGNSVIQFRDRSIVVDQEFARGVAELSNRLTSPSQTKAEKTNENKKYLLIYENDDLVEYEEQWAIAHIPPSLLSLPKSLNDGFSLKPHQVEGLNWLQRNFLLEGKKGCILADDMGLGKTLQILTFIAWLIERGELTPENSRNPDAAPWSPILIVTPVMLLENETWIQDMKRFFKNDGSIFLPWHILHGQGLKEMRTAGTSGQEITVQKPLLDLQRLRRNRIILTSYETIVNYQFSFASMKSDWTLVVTDEAQAQKTPKTKISHALKSLAPRFRIACTGTPVETRLLDVWNIMDYIQPGGVLGSATEFSRDYEQSLHDNPEGMQQVLEKLRTKLHFNRPTAFIKRREKTDTLTGLPKKIEHKVYCELSPLQLELHNDYMRRAREGGDGNHPFALIQGLMKLYQHPALIPKYTSTPSDTLSKITEGCPKIDKFIEILEKVKRAGEKALIFTRSVDMQQLLAFTIYEAFGQRVDIVNGAADRNETITSSKTRKSMISRFRSEKHLNFIILSPEVAGIGLTLVEANHVIHYGRWWNPAKESQATDRAYRIGQEREVNVYYLIAKDPLNRFKTFDEKLDALIDKRKQMAKDFLAPIPGESELQNELYKELFEGQYPGASSQAVALKPDDVRSLPWDRFESLIAVLEQKNGGRVVLTPQSGDMGMDVISFQGNQVRLIQCKHKRYGDDLDPCVIAETLNALDTYRARIFAGKTFTLQPVIATNGRIPNTVMEKLKEYDIDVINDSKLSELLAKHSPTISDIEFMEASRISSLTQIFS